MVCKRCQTESNLDLNIQTEDTCMNMHAFNLHVNYHDDHIQCMHIVDPTNYIMYIVYALEFKI